MSDVWRPANSKFKFSDSDDEIRYGGNKYGTVFFAQFEMGANITEDCKADCDRTYLLQVKYLTGRYYREY